MANEEKKYATMRFRTIFGRAFLLWNALSANLSNPLAGPPITFSATYSWEAVSQKSIKTGLLISIFVKYLFDFYKGARKAA